MTEPMAEAITDYALYLKAEGKGPATRRKYTLAGRAVQDSNPAHGMLVWSAS